MGKERERGDGTAQRFRQLSEHLGSLAVKGKEVGKVLNVLQLMLFVFGDYATDSHSTVIAIAKPLCLTVLPAWVLHKHMAVKAGGGRGCGGYNRMNIKQL